MYKYNYQKFQYWNNQTKGPKSISYILRWIWNICNRTLYSCCFN